MTNERAVEILNLDLDILGQYGDETAEAYKMAIKALDAQPCEDCISRAYIEPIVEELENICINGDEHILSLLSNIKNAPSVTPQPCEEDIHREREQAYMLGYEDASKKFRTEPCEDAVSRSELMKLYKEWQPRLATNVCEFEQALEDLPSVKPQTVTEFADKCKECGKIQNEFFNFDAPMVKNSEAVSREAVIRLVEQYPNIIGNRCSGLISDIKHLPSVTPQRPKGKWIKTQSGDKDFPESIVCSRCKNENSHLDFDEHSEPIGKVFVTSKYCPNCGAEMSGGGEDEDGD